MPAIDCGNSASGFKQGELVTRKVLTHFDVDVGKDLPLVALAMDPPQLMQALHLLFRHGMAGCMCKEGSHAAPTPVHLCRQLLRLGGKLSLVMGHVGFVSQGREAEICRNFHHILVFLPPQCYTPGS